MDIELARRLERAEATANAAFVEARARLDPLAGATWIEIAGVYAMFDGVKSPLTQTFGLGLFEPFLEPEFDRVEEFFSARGASTFHEVSSFVPDATVRLLHDRGYAPVEHSTVLVRTTTPDRSAPAHPMPVRRIDESECERWAQISAQGWRSEGEDLAAFVEAMGLVISRSHGTHCFIAESNGEPVAAGAMNLAAGVALLAGASTIPAARGRGAQLALLQARLSFAAAHGIDLAMIVTQPSSGSQRNAERQGFRPVYSRTKWERGVRLA